MMKYLFLLGGIFCIAQSQRPPYAGSSNRYPIVLPQFRDEQAAASGSLANRIDVESGNAVASENAATGAASGIASAAAATSTIPPNLPVDAHGDIDLINRIKTWPKEKQPFWYLNWQQIEEHRGDTSNRAQPVLAQPNTRSFFAG